jgi:hypothetical protein
VGLRRTSASARSSTSGTSVPLRRRFQFGQIDKSTGQPLSDMPLPSLMPSSFAVAYWGGDFYFFVGSSVTQYVPSTQALQQVASLNNGELIVGVGVSTCAPQ